MKKKSHNNRIKKRKHFILGLLLFILLLGIGYSTFEVALFLNGNVGMNQFTKDEERASLVSVKSTGGEYESFHVLGLHSDDFYYDLELKKLNTSSVTIEVVIHNYGTQELIFDGVKENTITSPFTNHSNSNIQVSVSGMIPNGTILGPGDSETLYLTFSYIDGTSITDTQIAGTIDFSFTELVTIHYDGLTNQAGETEEKIRYQSYDSFTPQVNLGSYTGTITITDNDNNELDASSYTFASGIVTFNTLDDTKEYTIHATASTSGTETIEDLIDEVEPDTNGIYTGTPGDGCTNTFVYDGTADNNLRYVGSNPCNYVQFNCDNNGENCELWRIIGVFNDVDDEPTFKMVKSTLDYSGTAWNSTTSNTWETSSLYNTLNTTYFNSINSKYQALILETKWNIGGIENTWTSPNFYAKEHEEKSTNPFYVGVFSPADYGYATSGGGTARATCISSQLNGSGYTSNCRTNNWFYSTASYQWTLVRRPSSANNQVYYITTAGLSAYATVTSNSSYYNYRPCVYLKPDVTITGGDGSQTDPYTFKTS